MKRIFILLFVVSLVFWANSPVRAALFVSGDSNIIDPLIGIHNGVPGIDTGNQRFFANILGGGNSVAVLQSTNAWGAGFVADVNQFYNSLAGVTSTVISGTINSLQGYNLLVAPLPDHAFTAGEITVLSNFLAVGNSVFFLGENNNSEFTAENTNINNDLAALGSSMRIVPDLFDAGFHVATGSRIVLDSFTTGVTTFSYAAPSQVTGGTYLFYGTGGQPFVEYSGTTSVPETFTMLLLSSGLVGILGFGRKFRN